MNVEQGLRVLIVAARADSCQDEPGIAFLCDVDLETGTVLQQSQMHLAACPRLAQLHDLGVLLDLPRALASLTLVTDVSVRREARFDDDDEIGARDATKLVRDLVFLGHTLSVERVFDLDQQAILSLSMVGSSRCLCLVQRGLHAVLLELNLDTQELTHTHTTPALAYIANSKQKRKHVIALSVPGRLAPAVVVEADGQAFVYNPLAKSLDHLQIATPPVYGYGLIDDTLLLLGKDRLGLLSLI
jgi:hypothetical protein